MESKLIKQLTTINMTGPDGVYREFHPIFKEQLIGIWCSHFGEIQRKEYFTNCLIFIFEMIALTPKPNNNKIKAL